MNRYKGLLTSLDGDYLREMRPNYIPVRISLYQMRLLPMQYVLI